ncbi:MAG: Potassium efflux system KefA protein / Small-conductance mechanosensitive channel [Gemmatimonadetes bacterium]|nr:Potassium efflux system KefA protein / Small-conductance mechanosensitive channel [Gemmatimonadota bacterium]
MISPAARGLAALAAILTLAGTAPAAEQRAQTDTARAATDSVRAAMIRGEDIPSQADQTAAQLRDFQSLLAADPAVARIVEATDLLTDSIDAVILAQQAVTRRLMTRRALADYTIEWERRAATVQEWRRTLRNRIGALQAGREDLANLASRWTAAIELARNDSTGRAVLGLAEGTLQDVRRTEREVKERRDQLLTTEVKLSDVQLKIQRQRDALALQAAEQRKDLFRIDSPPLWRIGNELSLSAVVTELGPLLQEDLRALTSFIEAYGIRILFHLLLTVLLIQFFRRGLARLQENPDDPLHAEPASAILQRPEAAAILVATISVLWFYPRAPLIIYDLALLASVAPLLRLRAVLVPEHLLRPGQLVGLALVLQRLVTITASGTGLERVIIMTINVVGAGLLWLGLRPGGTLRARDDSRWLVIFENVARIGLAGFLISAAANLVGNASLAATTTGAVLLLSYEAMVLVAATRVLDVALSETLRVGSRHSVFIRTYGDRIKRRGYWLLSAGAMAAWIWLALFSFYLTDDVSALVGLVLGTSWSVGHVHLSLGTVLLFGAVLWIGTMIARFNTLILELDVLGRLSLARGVPVTVGSLVRYALVTIAFLVALAATGFEVSQLAIIGGALGVGIGFGLQNIVANFIAGLILAFERPISVGDSVQLAEMTGEVRQIGIRASIIRTYDGAEVIVPNSELISREVINWTRSDRLRRIEVLVGVAYGTNPAQVLQLLLNVASTHPEVAAIPEPDARFVGFGDSSLDFSLRFWGDFSRWTLIQSSVAVTVHDALAAAGISIPFPQRDLHLVSANPELVGRIGIPAGDGTASP